MPALGPIRGASEAPGAVMDLTRSGHLERGRGDGLMASNVARRLLLLLGKQRW